MDNSQTPRALIEHLIENKPNELPVVRSHKSDDTGNSSHAANTRPRRSPRNQLSNKRSFTEAETQLTKKHRNMMNESDHTVTPRSAIEAFLQGTSNIEQTSKRNEKGSKVTPGKKVSSLSTSRIISSAKKTDLRKKATLKHLLKSQSFSSGPTPRGMIEGFIAGVDESTPAVKERSVADVMNSTGLDEILISHRRNVSSLGESYYLPNSAPESSGDRDRRAHRTSPRLRKHMDLEEFALETAEKIERMREGNESTKDTRATSQVTELLVQPDVSSFNNKTGELDRIASRKQMSMRGHETDGSLVAITPDSVTNSKSRLTGTSSKGSAVRRSSVRTGDKTLSPSSVSSEKRASPRLSVRGGLEGGDSVQSSVAKKSEGLTTPSGVLSLQSTETVETVTGRGRSTSSNLKEKLLVGTIQEVIAHAVPASDSLLTSLSEQTHVSEHTENSTTRLLRSRNRMSSMGERYTSSADSPGRRVLRSSVSHNEIVQDDVNAEKSEETGVMEGVEEGHNEEEEEDQENEGDTDDEQMQEEDNDSDSNQDVSSDDGQDKENLPVPEVEDPDHFQSNIGKTPEDVTSAVVQQPLMTGTHASGEITAGTSNTQPQPTVKRRSNKSNQRSSGPCLPRSLTKGIFSHFSQFKFSKDVLNEVELIAETFWKNTVDDLSHYAQHANRATLQHSDIELLMKRQGFVTEKQSLHTLVRRWLPLEYRSQLIPVASSKNTVYPRDNVKATKTTV